MNEKNFKKDEPADLEEFSGIIKLFTAEKDSVEAPREILQNILRQKELSSEAKGRSSWLDNFNKLINNLNPMDQKLKASLYALGVVAILAVGIVALKSGKNSPQTAIAPKVSETKLATTSPVIGNKEVDAQINKTLDAVLNEDDINSEISDADLALADEAAIDEINNLTNDDEL